MNREIKFRVWDKKFRGKKKMCYPDETGYLNIRGVNPNLRHLMMMNTPYNDRLIFHQFTGLKDKNGKEIYEGDILQDSFATYQVMFAEGSFFAIDTAWGLQDALEEDAESTPYLRALIVSDGMKVVGNIFENPELLK